jgi:hypothetical protein
MKNLLNQFYNKYSLRHNTREKLWRINFFIKIQPPIFFHLSPKNNSKDDLRVRHTKLRYLTGRVGSAVLTNQVDSTVDWQRGGFQGQEINLLPNVYAAVIDRS